jgi:hypothetical protein
MRDNQTSLDGDRNGLFTGTLRSVWRAAVQGNYRNLRDTIVAKMPNTQTPNYFFVGNRDPKFERKAVHHLIPLPSSGARRTRRG